MVKITKLPPGTALDAHDLQKWALRRELGKSGTGSDAFKTILLSLWCSKCKYYKTEIPTNRVAFQRMKWKCPRCGANRVKVSRTSQRVREKNKLYRESRTTYLK